MANTIPIEFYAGDSVTGEFSIAGFLPSEYAASLLFLNSNGKFEFVCIQSPDDANNFKIILTNSDTAAFSAGAYSVYAIFTKVGERKTVLLTNVTVNTDLSVIDALDTLSHNKKVLAAIEAVIEGRASIDQMSYSIQGRSLSRMHIKDLLYFKDYYAQLVVKETLAEQQKLGLTPTKKNKVYIKFGR